MWFKRFLITNVKHILKTIFKIIENKKCHTYIEKTICFWKTELLKHFFDKQKTDGLNTF